MSELRTTYIRPPHDPHIIWMSLKPNAAGAFRSFSLYWPRSDVPDDAATFSTRFTFCPCLGGPVWVLCIIRCFSRDVFCLHLLTSAFYQYDLVLECALTMFLLAQVHGKRNLLEPGTSWFFNAFSLSASLFYVLCLSKVHEPPSTVHLSLDPCTIRPKS